MEIGTRYTFVQRGASDLPPNYLPMSLLSCIGTLMERLVYKHIYIHLIVNNLINKNKFSF